MAEKKVTSYPKEKISILLLENISKTAIDIFENADYVTIKKLNGALSEEELIKEIKGVHLLGIRSKTTITKAVLQAAPKLQAIGCFCIGTNQVDMLAAMEHGVAVFNAPYSNTRSVAELVIGASIMLVRKVLDKNTAAHNKIWQKDAAGSNELRGKTMGLIGYGNIGSQVSVLAEALGMKVVFYDIETKLPLGNANACKSLKELLQKADVVSLHVPENATTENLINKNNIAYFKNSAVLINYARGTVVDLQVIAKAIKNKQLAGIAVDVFPIEPEKNGDSFESPLQNLPNVLLTPHIGGSTVEAQNNIGEDVASKLLQYLEKGITTGSHSMPALALPLHEGAHRILHIHHNVPGVLSEINTVLSKNKINIVGQYLKTNDSIGYVVLDIDKNLSKNAVELLRKVKETIKVRLLF
jgi:D-3-phosphoglycerate dehydrogenase / 2-oxoglutarate reductase